MPLQTGARLGPYEIKAAIGAGGMGEVLYEMLTGSRAFERDTAAETMTAVIREEPDARLLDASGAPPALVRVVWRCLEKDPVNRFQTARDLAFAVDVLYSGCAWMAAAAREPCQAAGAMRPARCVSGAERGARRRSGSKTPRRAPGSGLTPSPRRWARPLPLTLSLAMASLQLRVPADDGSVVSRQAGMAFASSPACPFAAVWRSGGTKEIDDAAANT